jgi:hypothetical protein
VVVGIFKNLLDLNINLINTKLEDEDVKVVEPNEGENQTCGGCE